MRKQVKYKLDEFYKKRKFANGLQRKQYIDQEVTFFLERRCTDLIENIEAYNYYKSLRNRVTLE